MADFSDFFSRDTADAELPLPLSDPLVIGTIRESVALSHGRQIPVTTRDSRVPVLTARPKARWIGTPDSGLIQTTTAPFAHSTLLAEELATIVVIPNTVIEDQTFPLFEAVRPLLTQAMSTAVDNACLWNIDKPPTFGPSVIEHAWANGNTVPADVFNPATDLAGVWLRAAQTVSQQGYAPRQLALAPGAQFRGGIPRTSALVANPLAQPDDPFPMLFSGIRVSVDPLTWAPPSAPRADTGCGTTEGSADVTDAAAGAGDAGMPVHGDGVPEGALITAVDPGTGFTMSLPATATATVTLNVGWPSVDAIIGQWDNLLIGMRREITMASFTSGVISDDSGVVTYNLMQQDAVALRVTMRLGFLVTAPPTAYAGSTKSPFCLVVNSGSEGPVG